MLVVDKHGVAGIADAIAEQGTSCISRTYLTLVVEIVSAFARYARGVSPFFELKGTGDVIGRVAVGTSQVETHRGGNAAAHFRNVWQADNEAGQSHGDGRTACDGCHVDRCAVAACVGKDLSD